MLNKLWYVHLPRPSHFLANSNKKASKIKKMWKAWTGTEPNCWNRYSLSSDTLDSVKRYAWLSKRYAYWAIVCSFLHFLLARTYQFIISASVYHVTLNTMHNSRCFSGICSKPKHPTWMQYKIPPEWTLCRAMSSSRTAFSFSCLEAHIGRQIDYAATISFSSWSSRVQNNTLHFQDLTEKAFPHCSDVSGSVAFLVGSE